MYSKYWQLLCLDISRSQLGIYSVIEVVPLLLDLESAAIFSKLPRFMCYLYLWAEG